MLQFQVRCSLNSVSAVAVLRDSSSIACILMRWPDLAAQVLVGMPTRYLLTARPLFPRRLAKAARGRTIQAFLVPTLFKETQMTKLRIQVALFMFVLSAAMAVFSNALSTEPSHEARPTRGHRSPIRRWS